MLRKDQLKSLFSDIRTWILLFFLMRLVGITNAPLEISHNWRQSLTNMIARNFFEGGPSLLYPRIDMAGNQTGIIGSEFPFFNYLIYLVSQVFDYSHWYGRLINLIISSSGIYYYYLLVGKLFDKRIAFNSSIVLLVSIWFAFSRKIMPDTFSVSLVIIGLYYAYEYHFSGRFLNLLLFILLSALGILCKIPALSLLALISILPFVKEIAVKRRIAVMIGTAISIFIIGIWYFYWVPHLLETYHYQLYFPKGLKEGFKEILPFIPGFFEKFYFSSLCSYFAFGFFLAGLYFIIKDRNRYVLAGFSLISAVFFIFILKTGSVFPTHNYYIIPFTPIMALLSGIGIAKIPSRFQYIPLIIISIEGVANQQHDFFIKNGEKYKLELEAITDKIIQKNELIVINGGASPQLIYFSNRKGWTIENEKVKKSTLDSLKNIGASFLIIDKKTFSETLEFYPLVFKDDNFDIYRLK